MANEKIRFDLTASDQTAAAFNTILGRLESVDKSAKRASDSAVSLGGAFRGAFAGVSVGLLAGQFAKLTDEFTSVTARLANVTNGTANFISVQQQLLNISQENRTAFSQTTDLYSSLARATQDLRVPQETLLRLTDGIGKALVVSGASGQSASAALIQLAQGFAAGALRGQEFVSVQEQAPEILRAVSKGLGVTTGELKKLSEEGKLTTQVFIDGFMKGLPQVEKQFANMPVTIGQALTRVNNSILITVGTIDKMTGTSSAIAEWLTSFSKGIDQIVPQINKLKETSKIADAASEVIRLDKQLKALESRPRNLQMVMGLDVEEQIKTTRAQLESAKRQFNAIVQNQPYDALRMGSRRFVETGPTPATPKTKEQEAAEKRIAKFLEDQQEQLIKISMGERALALDQAKRIGLTGKGLEDYMATYDKIVAIKKQDQEIDAISAEFEKIRKDNAADRKKAEEDALRLSEKQVKSGEIAINYLEKYREDMDIILDQIAIKNDGIFRTAEQQLIENSRLQLTKKYNEEIVKIKNVRNLTEQGQLNAIAAANIKYQEQIALVDEIAKKRMADRNDLTRGIRMGVANYFEEVNNLSQLTEDATIRAMRGMEDALTSFVANGKLSFRDLANSIIQDLIRIQIRQLITMPFAGMINNFLNPGTPMGILPGDSPLSANSATIMGRRAMGGPVTGGQSYLVGENGPEIFTPGASGGITPNNQIGGGGVTIVQNINVTTGVQQTVRAEIMTLMPQIAGAAKAAVADAKLRGGSYAAALR